MTRRRRPRREWRIWHRSRMLVPRSDFADLPPCVCGDRRYDGGHNPDECTRIAIDGSERPYRSPRLQAFEEDVRRISRALRNPPHFPPADPKE